MATLQMTHFLFCLAVASLGADYVLSCDFGADSPIPTISFAICSARVNSVQIQAVLKLNQDSLHHILRKDVKNRKDINGYGLFR
jgi:hypothetical protein